MELIIERKQTMNDILVFLIVIGWVSTKCTKSIDKTRRKRWWSEK